MSCLSGFLNSKARIYSIDRSEFTESGQPLETLTFIRNQKVYYAPYSMRDAVFKLFSAGQIKTGDYLCVSLKQVTEDNIIEIELDNYTKYQVDKSFPLRVGMKTLGYQLTLTRYRH